MIIKQRKVRRGERFGPRFIRSSRRQKEVIVSNYSMAIIQIALAIALLIASYQSCFLLRSRVTDLSLIEKYSIPILFFLAGILVLRSAVKKIRHLRKQARERSSNTEKNSCPPIKS